MFENLQILLIVLNSQILPTIQNLIPPFISGAILAIPLSHFLIYLLKNLYYRAIRAIAIELDQHYFCEYRIFQMARVGFVRRFANYFQLGFCYTFSAIVALSFKKFRNTRIVRGYVWNMDHYSRHSWTEVRLYGVWFVVDLTYTGEAIIDRFSYYRITKPKVKVVYRYQDIWRDPAAEQYYERLSRPETSTIFYNICNHYSPNEENGIEIPDLGSPDDSLPRPDAYTSFIVNGNKRFTQEVFDEIMLKSIAATKAQKPEYLTDEDLALLSYQKSPV